MVHNAIIPHRGGGGSIAYPRRGVGDVVTLPLWVEGGALKEGTPLRLRRRLGGPAPGRGKESVAVR